jgi:transposase
MMKPAQEEAVRRWVELIVAVWSRRLSVTVAAQKLRVSRKTFYQKEARALQGMVEALRTQPPGRPRQAVDPEQAALRRRNHELEERLLLLEQRWHIREVLCTDRPAGESGTGGGKKERPCRSAERTDGEHEGQDGSELSALVSGLGRSLCQPDALARSAGPR